MLDDDAEMALHRYEALSWRLRLGQQIHTAMVNYTPKAFQSLANVSSLSATKSQQTLNYRHLLRNALGKCVTPLA